MIVPGYFVRWTSAVKVGRGESAEQWFGAIRNSVGRLIMPFVRAADEGPYVCTLRWILSETKDDLCPIIKYGSVGWVKLNNRFCYLKDAVD